MSYRTNERGFALVAAVFALVIIAALVTGAFFAARQELRTGRSSQTFQRAFGAAEAGLNNTVADWQTGQWNAMAPGDSATISDTLPSNTGSYAGTVRRLNNELFLIRTVGTDPSGASQRTLATLVRLLKIEMNFPASLTTRGDLKLGGSSLIDGRDAPPSGWACPLTGLDTLPGVTTPDPSRITTSGCSAPGGDYKCIIGDPDVKTDTTINDSTFFKFGDVDFDELAEMATKVYPPGDIGPLNQIAPLGTATTCQTNVLDNWGEPYRPGTVLGCLNYFPIIYVEGNLQLTGGRGQGILLVGGNLNVQGGFEFFGPVIVRGVLTTGGTGGHFSGGVMAANVDLTDQSSILGDAVVTYSSCAVNEALKFNAPGRILRNRSWAEIF
ncbi:MAG: hypothetical protein HYR48_07550 [Gemmatimonadetes bacterium]|nr:hypothetical protein [Gemmatimonadota bacterium]